jgi:hypothetical protein
MVGAAVGTAGGDVVGTAGGGLGCAVVTVDMCYFLLLTAYRTTDDRRMAKRKSIKIFVRFVFFVIFVIQKLIADSYDLPTIVRFAHQLTTNNYVLLLIP